MEIEVNGETHEFEGEELTVAELLEALDVEHRESLAVAVGTRVVASSQWSDTCVSDGDRVEIIRAAQGG